MRVIVPALSTTPRRLLSSTTCRRQGRGGVSRTTARAVRRALTAARTGSPARVLGAARVSGRSGAVCASVERSASRKGCLPVQRRAAPGLSRGVPPRCALRKGQLVAAAPSEQRLKASRRGAASSSAKEHICQRPFWRAALHSTACRAPVCTLNARWRVALRRERLAAALYQGCSDSKLSVALARALRGPPCGAQ